MLDVKEQNFTVNITKGKGNRKWFTCTVRYKKLTFGDYMSALQEGATEVEKDLAMARRSEVEIDGYPEIDGHKITTLEELFNLPAGIMNKNPDHLKAAMRLLRETAMQATMSEETEKN